MNLALLVNFTKQDLVDRYSGSILGSLWTLILPLVNILIFIFIFSNLMGGRLPGSSAAYSYSIYLISGMLGWMAFSNTVIRSVDVFSEKSPIIKKVKISLPHLPLYILLSESVVFIISMCFFFIFLIVTGTEIHKTVILVPFIFAVQQIFAYALGFLLSIFNVFIKDIREFTGVIFQVWFWLNPIVYVSEILPDSAKIILEYNPAYFFIKAYHDIFVFNHFPSITKMTVLIIIAHVLLVFAYLIFKKLERDIRDFI